MMPILGVIQEQRSFFNQPYQVYSLIEDTNVILFGGVSVFPSRCHFSVILLCTNLVQNHPKYQQHKNKKRMHEICGMN